MTNRYKLIVLVVPTRAIWIGKHLEEEKKVHEMFISVISSLLKQFFRSSFFNS